MQVIAFIVALLLVAGLLAYLVNRILSRLDPPSAKQIHNPVWHELIYGSLRPDDVTVILAVELKSGRTILGALKTHESKPDKTLAWLVLMYHPKIDLQVRQPDGQVVPLGDQWEYVFISGDEIRAVEVLFQKMNTTGGKA